MNQKKHADRTALNMPHAETAADMTPPAKPATKEDIIRTLRTLLEESYHNEEKLCQELASLRQQAHDMYQDLERRLNKSLAELRQENTMLKRANLYLRKKIEGTGS